jgi:hypothetical protein
MEAAEVLRREIKALAFDRHGTIVDMQLRKSTVTNSCITKSVNLGSSPKQRGCDPRVNEDTAQLL